MSFKQELQNNKKFNKLFDYDKVAKVNNELNISFKQFTRFLSSIKIEGNNVIWIGDKVNTSDNTKKIKKVYGRFRWGANNRRYEELAHRLYMFYIQGRVLSPIEHVKHDIGVNILNLNKTSISDNKTNLKDKAFDETHDNQKLSPNDAFDIIIRRLEGATINDIRKKYHYVTKGTISAVSRLSQKRNWGGLKEAIENFLENHSLSKLKRYIDKNGTIKLYQKYGNA